MNKKDNIYSTERPHLDFIFDDKVADVFSDMINRSVPGYATIVEMIGMLADRYAQKNSVCYDLGCSLGASTLALQKNIHVDNCRIVAVDNSTAMIDRCRQEIQKVPSLVPVELICGDLNEIEIKNASVIVLNFTLQFIKPEQRKMLMEKIYKGLLPGGMLLLSEKIYFEDKHLDELFVDMHHRFKYQNGYSKLEISRKRAAIENVLIPETIEAHGQRMSAAGFTNFDVWFQCFNFASMVAIKS